LSSATRIELSIFLQAGKLALVEVARRRKRKKMKKKRRRRRKKKKKKRKKKKALLRQHMEAIDQGLKQESCHSANTSS